MAMVSTLFFAWGFLTCLNDILIPHLKNIFGLNYSGAMLVPLFFFSSYFVFSMPAGKIIEWIGYKRAMVTGLVTMAAGALLFVPAASIPSFPLFLTALIVLAAGMTILQTSANPYVAILGPPRTASSRLNLTQGFNSVGTTVAPWFGRWLILGAAVAPLSVAAMQAMSAQQLHAYRVQQAATVKAPYIGLALALFILAVIVGSFKLPAIQYAEAHSEASDSIWRHRRLVLGAMAIFVYVGAEVAIGSLMTNYFNEKEIGNMSLQSAAGYLQILLGRCNGWPLCRSLAIATGTHSNRAGCQRNDCGSAGNNFYADLRPRGDVDSDPGRPLQLDDVSEHLHAGDRRIGPVDWQSFRAVGGGHRGGRTDS
jgi:FHS family L-fucose permease-like MFS transporter